MNTIISRPIAFWSLVVLLMATGFASTGAASSLLREETPGIWRDVSEARVPGSGARAIVPARYRTLHADMDALEALLDAAPLERTAAREPVLLDLPMPDGRLARFRVERYSMMEPALAARFPSIRTYLGQGVEDPATTLRADLTPGGFHAMVLGGESTVYIDPYRGGDREHYISYWKHDVLTEMAERLAPDVVVDSVERDEAGEAPIERRGALSSGDKLRTYRLAMAATGEYTQYHNVLDGNPDDAVEDAMEAITTAMNRVNGIYEREIAARMILVDNNQDVIFTDPLLDPYTINNGAAMLAQNQATLDLVIGSANYDVGHVFSTGGGGIAGLRVVCNSLNKGRGVTGLSNPIGDPFYVDYVSHELGHQFGGNHTFNGTTNSCGGGNRNGSTAYEPGSASTIMGYAGICGAENLQPNSDDHFHTISFDEMFGFISTGPGNSCASRTDTGNTPPTVDAGPDYTIPANTPFTLTGSGYDADGDPLTYTWEEFDLGAPSPPNHDRDGIARPLFRSYQPVSDPVRTFPRLSNILNDSSSLGETLPSITRVMTFRLAVRDNRAGGGGVAYDEMVVSVRGTAGPFTVTAPNTAVIWTGGATESVTWNVANTTSAPISCAAVDIHLSTDGGSTFAHTLALATANDGSHDVTVPNAPTEHARIRVACSDNIFFDISNSDFTIEAGGPTLTPTATATATTIPSATSTASTPGATATSSPSATTGAATPTVTGTSAPVTPSPSATTSAATPTVTGTSAPASPSPSATYGAATPSASPTATSTLINERYLLPILMK